MTTSKSGPKAVEFPASRRHEELSPEKQRFFERACIAAMSKPVPPWFLALMPAQPEHPTLENLKSPEEAPIFQFVAELIAPSAQAGMQGTPGQMQVQERQSKHLGTKWSPENIHTHPKMGDIPPKLMLRLREYGQSLLDYQDAADEWVRLQSEELEMQWPTYYAWRQLEELERRASDAWEPQG